MSMEAVRARLLPVRYDNPFWVGVLAWKRVAGEGNLNEAVEFACQETGGLLEYGRESDGGQIVARPPGEQRPLWMWLSGHLLRTTGCVDTDDSRSLEADTVGHISDAYSRVFPGRDFANDLTSARGRDSILKLLKMMKHGLPAQVDSKKPHPTAASAASTVSGQEQTSDASLSQPGPELAPIGSDTIDKQGK